MRPLLPAWGWGRAAHRPSLHLQRLIPRLRVPHREHRQIQQLLSLNCEKNYQKKYFVLKGNSNGQKKIFFNQIKFLSLFFSGPRFWSTSCTRGRASKKEKTRLRDTPWAMTFVGKILHSAVKLDWFYNFYVRLVKEKVKAPFVGRRSKKFPKGLQVHQ